MHDITACYGSKNHCWWCQEDEPVTGATYKICGECYHAYQTISDLQREWVNNIASPAPSEIFFCPLCAHDF